VVWHGDDGTDYEIFLYDGTITPITVNDYDDRIPKINNNGEVVWQSYGGPDSEILLYDGISTTWITDNDVSDVAPQINDSGQVVWYGDDGSEGQIYFYDGSSVTQITNTSFQDQAPQINNNGELVWQGDVGTESEIYLRAACTDGDEDSYYLEGGDCGPVDCNDEDEYIYPYAPDSCDGIDQSCDGFDGTWEIEGNGIDDDCNPATPTPWRIASTVGPEFKESSDIANYLFFLIVPVGAVIAMRIIRRKK